MNPQNKQFKLKQRPVGMVKRTDFDFVTLPAGEPGEGEVQIGRASCRERVYSSV